VRVGTTGLDLLHRRATVGAGLPFAVGDQEVTAVPPAMLAVQVLLPLAAAKIDALLQRLLDRTPHVVGLLVAQRAYGPKRVDAGLEEWVLNVDVADTCHPLLVQQERLDPSSASTQQFAKLVERHAEKVWLQLADRGVTDKVRGIVREAEPPVLVSTTYKTRHL
jgi:hypothetical protein